MLARLSQRIVDWQIRKEYLAEKERSVYVYAYELLLNQMINVLAAAAIAVLFHDSLTVLLFLASYIPLRSYAGGFHANTNLGCTIVSALMICLICWIMGMDFPLWFEMAYPVCFLASGYMVFRYAPVQDRNKPLDDIERARYKERSRFLWGAEAVLGMVLFMLRFRHGVVIAVSHIILSAMLYLGLLKNRRSL